MAAQKEQKSPSTNASSVCLTPFVLESACRPPGGSLAGDPVCSAVSNPNAIKENLIQDYPNNTAQDAYPQGEGEQEVIEEGQ